jgi:hypothetical protein
MTAHCWPLLIFVLALLLPACLHVDATPNTAPPDQTTKSTPSQTTDPLRKTLFAELPSRPGLVVSKTNIKDTTPQRPIDASEAMQVAADPSNTFPIGPPQPNQLPEPPLLAAIRAQTEGRPEQAIQYLSALDKPNQEFVLTVLPVLERGATLEMKADPRATAILTDQLRGAAESIESLAALRLPVVTLCSTVNGYGQYDTWPKGQPYISNYHDRAWLYVEVRNLLSQPAVGPHGESYLTHARVTVEVRDAHKKLVDQPSIEEPRRLVPVVQYERKVFTRTPVHDFYILYGLPVPSAPGVYTVSMKIEDPHGRRVVNTEPIEFTVAGR